MKPSIAAIIVTKNEESMLANCIETVRWCDEIIVIDTGSQDHTVEIAEKLHVKVYKTKLTSFAEFRNLAMKFTKADWLFYIDADERVTPNLAKEIMVQIEVTSANALKMHRKNVMYGQMFEHGGWEKEYVVTIVRHQNFHGWQGEIHESPIFDGEPVLLHSPLLHFTHRNTQDGLHKTIAWTPVEAELLYYADTPPVTVWTLIRKGGMEFFRRAFIHRGNQDGMAGWIEAIVQGMNRIFVYIQVWERQQKPSLPEKYAEQERQIASLWKNTH